MYVYSTTELPLEKIVNRQIRCIVGNVEVTNAERAPCQVVRSVVRVGGGEWVVGRGCQVVRLTRVVACASH